MLNLVRVLLMQNSTYQNIYQEFIFLKLIPMIKQIIEKL